MGIAQSERGKNRPNLASVNDVCSGTDVTHNVRTDQSGELLRPCRMPWPAVYNRHSEPVEHWDGRKKQTAGIGGCLEKPG